MIPIMRAFDDPRYRRVVAVMGSQMGKTEAFWNVIGWRLDDDPTPILYIGPTQKLVESMSQDRVMKMLRSVPSLWNRLEKGKRNKITEKFVAGMRLGFAWAGSATELAGHPAGLVLVDERDRMDSDVSGEGDPVELAEARISTYPFGKLAVVSTPVVGTVDVYRHEVTGIEHWTVSDEVESPAWRLWQEGTRHEWAVPCPDCGDYFVPRLRHLKWDSGLSAHAAEQSARLCCINCGSLIPGSAMHSMSARGVFVAPGQSVTKAGDVIGDPPESDAATFWTSGLCSPWRTIGQRARSYVAAARSKDPGRLQSVINTGFGELWAERGEVPSADRVLQARAEYRLREVPDGAIVLTSGCDVQKDRIYYVVRAWGHELAAWLVDFGVVFGETDQPEVWGRLADVLSAEYGGRRIRQTFVDSGFRADAVYQFCRARPELNAAPSKGQETLSMPVRMSRVDVTFRGAVIKNGQNLWHVDSGYFKSLIHSRIDWPQDQPGAWQLPADVPEEYARQIIAESKITLPSGKVVWKRHDRENHALDCEVYAAAAARMLGVDRMRKRHTAPPAAATDEKQQPAAPVQQRRQLRPRGRIS